MNESHAPGAPMEIWAMCRDCDRWFYCEGWFDTTVPAPSCPVCGAEPSAIENRAAELHHAGQRTPSESTAEPR